MDSAHTSPPIPALQRGEACVLCRRRKMRCDGARPFCGQCARSNRPTDCEYSDRQGRTTTEILEENISRLEARIYELEHPEQTSSPVLLHHPYPHQSRHIGESQVTTRLDEPPTDVIISLIDFFLPYASEVGFYLSASRFRQEALLSLPVGHHARPIPALLNTVYLWGARMSNRSYLMEYENVFLSQALSQVSTSLSSQHPKKVLQTLQAEILLAYYFFSSARFLEAKYHVTVAISIGFSNGLHRIRTSRSTIVASSFPPANDSIEEGEQILACWTVLILDKCWAVAMESPPNLLFPSASPDTQVDTPWPLEATDYETHGLPEDFQSHSTVDDFLNERLTTNMGISTTALLAKASLIWEQVHILAKSNVSDLTRRATVLDRLLNGLHASVPRDRQGYTPSMKRTLLVAESVAHAAEIQFLKSAIHENPHSKGKLLRSAQVVLDLIASVDWDVTFLNPIMGSIWVLASQVFVDEIALLKSNRLLHSVALPSTYEKSLVVSFERALDAMSNPSSSCALMRYQLSQIREVFMSLEAGSNTPTID